MPESTGTPGWVLKVPPPLWGLAFFAAAFAADRLFAWPIVARAPALGVAVCVVGLLLSAWAALTFVYEDTELNPTSAGNKKLVAKGPFRFTRNPMYLGLTLIGLGLALVFGTLPFYLVPLAVFLFCNSGIVPFEEAKMRRQFGDQYTDYCRRVRRWL